MIKIIFKVPDTPDWNDWVIKCSLATQTLIEDFNNNKDIVITELYKYQKAIFTDRNNNFYGKCAYCESLITASQPGDMEHFRPKEKVTDSFNKPIIVENINGDSITHPGYYWLAYDYTNLLPACADCNRPSKGNSEGKLIGKWNQFPVIESYAVNPGEEVNELPYLINPVIEDPEEHLEIDSLGIMHAKSERGKKCIEIFGLNLRQSLVEERIRTYKEVKDKILLYFLAIGMKSPEVKERFDLLEAHRNGKKPHTIAARQALNDFNKETKFQTIFRQ